MMRAIVARTIGGPEVLALEQVPAPPPPPPGAVVVRIHAAGVNYSDTERRRGIYGAPRLPWIPGHEGAGVVEAVGAGVDPALEGARVAYFVRLSNSYAERATVPAHALFRFSRELPFEIMAALPQQGLTAHGLVRFAGIAPGHVVVVLAAAGGVGQLLVQLARRAGARVLAVVSTAAKGAAIEPLGGDVIVGYESFERAVLEHTGGYGADVVFDSVGRATQASSLAALAPYGQLVFYGDASGMPEPIDVNVLYRRSLRVGAFELDIDRDPDATEAARRTLVSGLEEAALRVNVSCTFPLADAALAHRELEARRSVGKLVLLP